jgi:hypothetical protein
MKIKSRLLLIAVVCLNYLYSHAQQNDTLEIQRRENGKISFARLKPDASRKISDVGNFFKTILQLKSDDELRLIKESTDNLGISHRLYQQYYKG